MNGRKNVGVLAGVTAVAIAAAVAFAVVTRDPPPLPAKPKKEAAAEAPAATPVAQPAKPEPPPAAKPAPPSPPPPPAAAATPSATPSAAAELGAMPLDELRGRANANDVAAMEEMGRRLLQGVNTAKDPQAGAGWLLRAANLGSAQSAFNVGVMYERGFVVERDSSKAAEWYRKAADAGLPAAKHNLALMLRDGKGVPRDVKAATALLLSAAHQGMAASMFTLGDIYEQGDGGTKDPASALAWFAITGEFERQTNRDGETPLLRTANQRAQILKRTLTTAELEQAQKLAQDEFKQIVTTLAPAPPAPEKKDTPAAPPAQAAPPLTNATIDWPKAKADQVKAVQQGLFDLKRLRDKPDGTLGPITRAAIRDFQKSNGLRETGEPSREVYIALLLAQRDVVSESPLPTPPASTAPEKPEPPKPEPPPVAAKPIDIGTPPPPPAAPTSAEIAAATPPPPKAPDLPKPDLPKPGPPKSDPPKPAPVTIETAKPAPPVAVATPAKPIEIPVAPAPPPLASSDIAAATPTAPAKPETPKPATAAWPSRKTDQVKAVQALLRDLRFYTKAVDGQASTGTTTAIREYQRMVGMKETGEPSKALFESLTEMRKIMMSTVPSAAN